MCPDAVYEDGPTSLRPYGGHPPPPTHYTQNGQANDVLVAMVCLSVYYSIITFRREIRQIHILKTQFRKFELISTIQNTTKICTQYSVLKSKFFSPTLYVLYSVIILNQNILYLNKANSWLSQITVRELSQYHVYNVTDSISTSSRCFFSVSFIICTSTVSVRSF